MKMLNSCSHPKCHDPVDIDCRNGEEPYTDCPYWKSVNEPQKEEKNTDENEEGATEKVEKKEYPTIDTLNVSWTGNSMGVDDLELIKNRSTPIIIGVVGMFNSGKTTFLSMVYLLLSMGEQLDKYAFSGSYTLTGWENISHNMRWNNKEQYSFPAHTSADIGRNQGYLHIAFRNGDIVRDIIFTDVPGEWYSSWISDANSDQAEGARRIMNQADGFLFFVDCEGLNAANNNRTRIRKQTENLSKRLKDVIGKRPLGVLWAKADTKHAIKAEILAKLERKIDIDFPAAKSFDISYLRGEDKDYHQNILGVISWIIDELVQVPKAAITIQNTSPNDYFLNYRGQ